MISILKFVLLNESPFWGHLWYLGAILYVLVIIYLFEKKWSRQWLYPFVPFLLSVDLLFGKYSLVIFGMEFPYILVRNFMFVGLPYFLIGDIIYSRKIRMNMRNSICFAVLFMFTTLIERYLLSVFQVNATRDHYISTTFLAVFVFLLAQEFENKEIIKWIDRICSIGKELSTYIYVLHPIVMTILAKTIGRVFLGKGIWNVYSFVAPFIILFSTIFLSWSIKQFNNVFPERNLTNYAKDKESHY